MLKSNFLLSYNKLQRKDEFDVNGKKKATVVTIAFSMSYFLLFFASKIDDVIRHYFRTFIFDKVKVHFWLRFTLFPCWFAL